MKKYLIKGVLALFAGIYLTSCADTETDYVPIAEQKAMAFEEVFKELYGEIDPHQDWGFGSGRIEVDPNDTSIVVEVVDLDGDIAYTRTVPFRGMDALLAFHSGTRGLSDLNLEAGANKNRNQWAATDGKFNLLVPTPLTEGQCNRVRAYFQTHRFLKWETPSMTNYFVQQVYTGGTNTDGSLSTEQYTKANTDAVVGAAHMDQLTVGSGNVHVLDFNGADNPNIAKDVLNNGVTQNSGKYHSDQITLMVGVQPTCVGYQSSEGNVQHNDCCALVGAKTIDDWAKKPANYVDGKPIGEDVWYGKDQYGYDNSTWNRSFVGLDYEQKSIESLYREKNGSPYAHIKDFMSKGADNYAYILYEGARKSVSSIDIDAILLFPDGEKVRWIDDNTNEFLGDNMGTNQNTFNKQSDGDYFDLDALYYYINQGAYPKLNNMEFIRNIGGRDYVFSDWIVTLTPAGPPDMDVQTYISETDIWTQIEAGRVFCEDLAKATLDDLDFNDVVFDVTVWENETYKKEWWERVVNGVVTDTGVNYEKEPATDYYASIILRAAGGTIPITVNGKDVHAQFKDGGKSVAEATMINTRDNKSTTFGSYISCEPVDLEGTDMKVRNYKVVKKPKNQVDQNEDFITLKMFKVDKQNDGKYIEKIPVWSSYGTAKQIQELGYVRGKAPKKFMVPKNSSSEYPKWTSERKNISLAYPGFGAWVQDATKVPWSNVNNNYTYDVEKPYSADGINLPLVIKARKTVTTDGEQYLWTGSNEYGPNWSLKETTADLNKEGDISKEFWPGDRLRFRASGIGDDAWISVSVGNITPYFIDSEFPNYVKNADGSRETRTEGCVEVLLDQDACDKLNNFVVNGKITFTVMGRNFTLTGITKVLFQ